MTAPLFLVQPGDLDGVVVGGTHELAGPEGRHAVTVRRLGLGEPVDLADGEGVVVRGEVTRADGGVLSVLVHAVVTAAEPTLRLVLVQALAKGGRDELAVETCTELGVDEVVPWAAQRCVVQWRGERGEKARQSWQTTARTASKQARRVRVPVVEPLADLSRLTRRVQAAGLALVLHEVAEEPLAAVELPGAGDVLLVVGPEGGIAAPELEALVAAGARAVRLGTTVLRSSTAGAAALAVLSVRAGRW